MSEQMMRDNLITLAQCYATAKRWSLPTVSKQIHGNQAFLENFMRGDTSPTVSTYFKMIETLRKHWPGDVEWPELAGVTLLKLTFEIPAPGLEPAGKKKKKPRQSK